MPLIADYHNHPLGHDPNRVYTPEILNQWLTVAQARGLSDIALTDHDRYHEGVDLEVFRRFKETLPSEINFKIGIELDNDPETSVAGHHWTEKNYDQLDFVLGSVHFIGDWPFDHPAHKAEFDKRNIDLVYKQYFAELKKIPARGLVDSLSHLDLIKIFGHRPSAPMVSEVTEVLEEVKKHDLSIELNTAGWSKPVGELYPENWIIELALKLNISITISSDSHAPNNLAKDYDKLAQSMKELGVHKIAVYEKHVKRLIDLDFSQK